MRLIQPEVDGLPGGDDVFAVTLDSRRQRGADAHRH